MSKKTKSKMIRGRMFKILCERKGITVKDLAYRSGVSKISIYDYLEGVSVPSERSLNKLSMIIPELIKIYSVTIIDDKQEEL